MNGVANRVSKMKPSRNGKAIFSGLLLTGAMLLAQGAWAAVCFSVSAGLMGSGSSLGLCLANLRMVE